MMTDKTDNIRYVDYIVVVHGIGEQRINETILPVINRIAELRHGKIRPDLKEIISLGMITSQTGKPFKTQDGKPSYADCYPWCEFDQIPQKKPKNPDELKTFYGEHSESGRNLRFVDMHWADIMQENFADVGEPVKKWADGLVARLELRLKKGDLPDNEQWILPILYRLEEAMVTIQALMSIKTPGVSDEIFNKYLGDVQIYGEYSSVRGHAVNRFHKLFRKIEDEHVKLHRLDEKYYNAKRNQYIKPRYTILSHSLGTVMALDSLMYAHISTKILDRDDFYPNVPFIQYQTEKVKDKPYFGDYWIQNVDSWITLGSPIDKFLTLWWNNYKYLGLVGEEIPPYFIPENLPKIKHFNYCDEQDPVGHSLDLLRARPVYHRYFECIEDCVYNRYAVPGAAHVDYWTDTELFKRILDNTIDGHKKNVKKVDLIETQKDFAYKEGIYSKILFFTYFFFPIIGTLIGTLGFTSAFLAGEGLTTLIISVAIFVITIYVTLRFIKLMIWWRQVLKIKRLEDTKHREMKQGKAANWFHILIRILIGFHTIGAFMYIPEFALNHKAPEGGDDTILVFVTAIIVTIIVHYKFRTIKEKILINGQEEMLDVSGKMTSIFGGMLALLVLVLYYFDVNFLKDLMGLEPSYHVSFAAYFGISAVLWFYTLACLLSAKNALKVMMPVQNTDNAAVASSIANSSSPSANAHTTTV